MIASAMKRISVRAAKARSKAIYESPVPIKFRLRIVKKEILKKSKKASFVAKITYVTSPREHPVKILAGRLKAQICSPEFWLGVLAGIVTRVTTRLAIERIFTSTHAQGMQAALTSFIACAAAGIAAGIAVHLARALYRNSKLPEGARREKYSGAILLRSALTGLLGGMFGGCLANFGSLFARAGSLVISTTAGATMGVPFALAVSRKQSEGGWGKWALQCIGFGAAGGVLGVFSADLFSVHESLAATVSDANANMGMEPSSAFALPNTCTTAPPVSPVPASMQCAIPPKAPLHPTALHAHRAVRRVHLASAKTHHLNHNNHHHHHQRVARLKHQPKHIARIQHGQAAQNAIARHTLPPLPPPVDVAAIPMPDAVQFLPHDPSGISSLQTPHLEGNQLALKGPCADPRMACVERVIFDGNGDATKVVLEAQPGRQAAAHFEVERPTVGTPHWNNAARGITTASTADQNAVQVSLVVPFVNRVAASTITAQHAPA